MTPIATSWQPRIRWFLAEFFIVLTGILVALLIQAWWQHRSDREKERSYLMQLSADLQQTIDRTLASDSAMKDAEAAGGWLIEAYQAPVPPPLDSILFKLRVARLFHSPRPVLATLQAMMSTGDIKLVRDDSLRSALTRYYDETLQSIEGVNGANTTANGAYAALNHLVDYSALLEGTAPVASLTGAAALVDNPAFRFVRPGERRARFARSAEELLSDRELFALLVTLQITKRSHLLHRQRQREGARALRERVEAELYPAR